MTAPTNGERVERYAGAIDRAFYGESQADWPLPIARAVMAVVDAEIRAAQARALREAANAYRTVEGHQHISPPAVWLHRHADEIEAGR